MTRPQKKAAERAQVAEVLRRLGIDPAEIQERESPDYALPRHRIGIELAELADPFIAEGQAALEAQRVALAEALSSAGIRRAVQISASEGFAKLLSPRRVRDENVPALVSLIAKHEHRPGYSVVGYDELVANGVRFIGELRLLTGSGGVSAGSSQTGRRAPFVQSCIDAKNAKVADYRANMPECAIWLVLVAGLGVRSAVWSVVVEDCEYVSAFDKTFCIDAFENKLIAKARDLDDEHASEIEQDVVRRALEATIVNPARFGSSLPTSRAERPNFEVRPPLARRPPRRPERDSPSAKPPPHRTIPRRLRSRPGLCPLHVRRVRPPCLGFWRRGLEGHLTLRQVRERRRLVRRPCPRESTDGFQSSHRHLPCEGGVRGVAPARERNVVPPFARGEASAPDRAGVLAHARRRRRSRAMADAGRDPPLRRSQPADGGIARDNRGRPIQWSELEGLLRGVHPAGAARRRRGRDSTHRGGLCARDDGRRRPCGPLRQHPRPVRPDVTGPRKKAPGAASAGGLRATEVHIARFCTKPGDHDEDADGGRERRERVRSGVRRFDWGLARGVIANVNA